MPQSVSDGPAFLNGEILKNGARVIESTSDVVLAYSPEVGEYVTWRISPDGHTYAGQYFFDDLQAAAAGYYRRAGKGLLSNEAT